MAADDHTETPHGVRPQVPGVTDKPIVFKDMTHVLQQYFYYYFETVQNGAVLVITPFLHFL